MMFSESKRTLKCVNLERLPRRYIMMGNNPYLISNTCDLVLETLSFQMLEEYKNEDRR